MKSHSTTIEFRRELNQQFQRKRGVIFQSPVKGTTRLKDPVIMSEAGSSRGTSPFLKTEYLVLTKASGLRQATGLEMEN